MKAPRIYHHHHHAVLVARISLTLSRHFSLSFIALGRSSGQHPVSSHSCWMYVRADCPDFARPCVGVHKSTSLMSSSLLLQQCPACLVRLTWIVFVIGGRWPYSWCLAGCCFGFDDLNVCLGIFIISDYHYYLSVGYTMLYSHIHKKSGNIIKDNDELQWTNEYTSLLKYISHTLFSKGLMFLWCVRDRWRQGQTAILTQLLLLIIARCVIFKNPLNTSSTSWLGLLNRGSLRAVALSGAFSVCKLVLSLAFLSSTNSTATGICLYYFITPTCFRFFLRLFNTQFGPW